MIRDVRRVRYERETLIKDAAHCADLGSFIDGLHHQRFVKICIVRCTADEADNILVIRIPLRSIEDHFLDNVRNSRSIESIRKRLARIFRVKTAISNRQNNVAFIVLTQFEMLVAFT